VKSILTVPCGFLPALVPRQERRRQWWGRRGSRRGLGTWYGTPLAEEGQERQLLLLDRAGS